MATHILRRTLLTSTALIGLGSVAIAQSTTEDETDDEAVSESTYLSPLTIGSGWVGAGDSFTKTAAVSSISKDEIGLFGGQNIDNAIRSQPGVSTRDNQQNTGVAVNIRGLEGSGRVAMSIDGARQNFRFTGHEAQGFTYVDPALLAGIDIQRGSADGASGAGALAGSADFRTIGVDDVLEAGDDFGGYVTSSIGNNGAGTAPSGAVAFRVNDTFALLAASSYRNTDNYKNGDGQEVANTYQETQSNLVKAEITPTADQKITISGMIYESDFYSNSYPQTVTNKTGTIKYDYTPEDNELVDLHANLYINDTTMNYGTSTTISGGGSARGRVIDDTGAGLDVTNTSRGALGDALIASTYGFSLSGDNVYVLNSTSTTATGVNPSGVSTLSSIFNSTTATVGAFDLTGGLRYDYYTASGEADDKTSTDILQIDKAEGRLLPSAKIALNNLDWITPYLSYDETFRAPTVNELMIGGSHPSGATGSYRANPELDPEYARTIELGANVVRNGVITADDSLQIKADVFYSLVDDYITYMSSGGYSYFGNNEGTSAIAGLELQAGYDAGFVFASLAYTHTETDLPSQVNGLGAQSYLPTDVFTATAGVRVLDNQALTLGGRISVTSDAYIGDINNYTSDPANSYTDGYTLVDLFANYQFDNGVELGASISNVFDVAYTPALSTTPSTSGQVTGRGRTIELTAKARF